MFIFLGVCTVAIPVFIWLGSGNEMLQSEITFIC